MRYIVIAILLFICGCATIPPSEEQCIENCEVPERFINPQKGQQNGISGKYVEEQDAINNAMIDARKRIVDALGIRVDRDIIEKLTTEGKTSDILASDISAVSNTEMKARAFIVGTRELEHWSQIWTRPKNGGIERYYKVYVLVEFSKEKHDLYMSDYISSRLNESLDLFQRAEKMAEKGDYQNAYNYYGGVLNLTEDIIVITAPPAQAIGYMDRIRSLREEAKSKRQGIEKYVENSIWRDDNWGDLFISLWTNTAEYTPGDTARLRLWANEDCYIYILDFWNGEFCVMFPAFGEKNKISKDQHYEFARDFGLCWIAKPPYGEELIKVFASTVPFSLPSADLKSEDFVEKIREKAKGHPYAEASRVVKIVRRE